MTETLPKKPSSIRSVKILESDLHTYAINTFPEDSPLSSYGKRCYLSEKELKLIERSEKLMKAAQGILDRAYRRG